jgi:hypothetical protein
MCWNQILGRPKTSYVYDEEKDRSPFLARGIQTDGEAENPSSSEVKIEWNYNATPSIHFHGVVLN